MPSNGQLNIPTPVQSKSSMKATNRVSRPQVAAGQVWRMQETECHIGQVGKTLVHYKLLKGTNSRVPTTLGNKLALEKHLKAKKAVLVKEAALVKS